VDPVSGDPVSGDPVSGANLPKITQNNPKKHPHPPLKTD